LQKTPRENRRFTTADTGESLPRNIAQNGACSARR
jgi:hypothetical protein